MSDIISSINPPAQRTFNSEESRCNICQEEFDTGDEPEIPLTLSCGHVLGSVCLSRWLHVPGRTNGCPMCRKTLFKAREESDDGYEEGEIEDEDDEGEDVDMLLEQEEAHWSNIINDHYNSRPAGSSSPIEEELSTEMHQIFGRWPSTSAIIEMLRSRTPTRNPALVIESLLRDHRFSSSTPLRRHNSYRQSTADLYTRLNTALSQASNWLSTHPTYNIHACSRLHHHLHLSHLATAADFRAHDKANLINLLKASIFTSPRMEDTSFSLRLLIAENLSTHLLPFGDDANPAGAHMYRVLDAMPNLCGVYEEINVAERRDPCHIAEYDFKGVWEADMAVGEAGLGVGRRSWDLMGQRGSPTTIIGGEAGAGEGQGEREGEADMADISAAVNRTLEAANSLLGIRSGAVGGGGEVSQEATTAEEGTESISRQIDRTLARAYELIRDMEPPQSAEHEEIVADADTEPRRGHGGRRGRGRGHRGGSGRQ